MGANCTLTYAETIGSTLDNKNKQDHVPKLVEIRCEGKFTLLWNQECKLTEPFLTINRIS
jgi:hypothetical protein